MDIIMLTKDYGHWDITLVGEFDPQDYYGFVYLVTNTLTGRMYIGKKSMWSTVTKKVWKVDKSGKKNIKVTKESNWRAYTTSSIYVNADIEVGQQFTFQILSMHTSKGTLAYNEVDQMVRRDVLRLKFPNGDRMYYNGNISGIKFIPPDEKPIKPKIIKQEKIRLYSDEEIQSMKIERDKQKKQNYSNRPKHTFVYKECPHCLREIRSSSFGIHTTKCLNKSPDERAHAELKARRNKRNKEIKNEILV